MTPKQLKAMKLALETLEYAGPSWIDARQPAITAIKEALAEHAMRETQRLGQEIEQEPVAYYLPHKGFYWAKPTSISAPTIADVEPLPLYTQPPRRTWVGLTDEEIQAFDTWHDNREEEVGWCNPSEIVAYIEAKLKEKNT